LCVDTPTKDDKPLALRWLIYNKFLKTLKTKQPKNLAD
jgi:hypothetical protein